MKLKGKTKKTLMKKFKNRKMSKSSKSAKMETDEVFNYSDLRFEIHNNTDSNRLKNGDVSDGNVCFNLNKYKNGLNKKKDKLSNLFNNKNKTTKTKVREGSLSNSKRNFKSNEVYKPNSSCSNNGNIRLSDLSENIDNEKKELEYILELLKTKLNELNLSHEFVKKHGENLADTLADLQSSNGSSNVSIKALNERSTIYKIAVLGVVNYSQGFIDLAYYLTQKLSQNLKELKLKSNEKFTQNHQKASIKLETNSKHHLNQTFSKEVFDELKLKQRKSNVDIRIQEPSEQSQQTTQPSKQNKRMSAIKKQSTNENDSVVLSFYSAIDEMNLSTTKLENNKPKNHSIIEPIKMDQNEKIENFNLQADIQIDVDNSNQEKNEINNNRLTFILSQAKNEEKRENIENEKCFNLFTDIENLKNINREIKLRRKEIPVRPNYPLNLWSIVKNCIGKDLAKLPLPVNFSEPISFLQRITEELEYSKLLDIAASCDDQWEQLAYIAAFTISSYSTTSTRINKPFNPLLGETYECDRLDDFGWRSIVEQVSHHPPALAMHVESLKDWVFYQDVIVQSKFRGQYLQVIPVGSCHFELKNGHHFTWNRVNTFVNNIILGKLWIENVGDVKIYNHKTQDACFIKYHPNSYFSRDSKNKVTAVVTDSKNIARYLIRGSWSDKVEGAIITNPQTYNDKHDFKTDKWKLLWERKYPPAHFESMHFFTEFAVELNEMEPNIAPTDSRLRPDQRLMEHGKWEEANEEKIKLEDKQRVRRKQMEHDGIEHIPKWFSKSTSEYINEQIYVFDREYWTCKSKKDWKRCPDIF